LLQAPFDGYFCTLHPGTKAPRPLGTLAALLAVLFVALNIVNALNKGGDADVFFEGGRRFLHGEALYEGSSAAAGFIGPPFQAVFFAPFALVASIHPGAAKLLWHLLNSLCLVAGVWLTAHTWWRVRGQLGLADAPWFPALFAPLVAILLPLQTNFEHQNMNALLLALLSGATWHLTLGSKRTAGVLIGAATALKAFPLLFILYLGARREWRAAAAAIATAIALTIIPLFVYGPSAYVDLLSTFWRLANSGWPVRGNNQSLVAALDRLANGFGADGVRSFEETPRFTMVHSVAAGALASMTIVALAAFPRRMRALIPIEIATVTILAILLSPIAWDHYWVLMFPAFLILYDCAASTYGVNRYAFWIAALLTTGLSPLTLGRHGYNVARAWSVNTLAGVIAYCALWLLWKRASGRATNAARIQASTAQSRR
jgi:alpha-1,2-mannosyltransferase